MLVSYFNLGPVSQICNKFFLLGNYTNFYKLKKHTYYLLVICLLSDKFLKVMFLYTDTVIILLFLETYVNLNASIQNNVSLNEDVQIKKHQFSVPWTPKTRHTNL